MSPSKVEANQTVSVVGQYFGRATLTFQYSGLPPGCTSYQAVIFACEPTDPGTFEVNLNVTDAEGASGNATAQLVVLPALSVYVAISSPIVDVGQPWNLSMTVEGGAPAYAFAYSGLPVGCSGSGPSVNCTPTTPEVTAVGIVVTDSLGASVVSNVSVTVNATPAISVQLSNAQVEVGEPESIDWSVSGGTPPLTTSLVGLPPGCDRSPEPPIICQPSQTGNFTIRVNTTDALGESAHAQVIVHVVPALALTSFVINPQPNIVEGTSILLIANVAGGIGPRTFSFVGLPPGCSSQNSSTVGCQPAAAGSWKIVLQVRDARGLTVSGDLNLSVAPSSAVYLTPLEWGAGLVGGLGILIGGIVILRRARGKDESDHSAGPPP
jgi:hypothetical protein